MNYIKMAILSAFFVSLFTGCSYVSDMVEGAIMERASFSANATYNSGDDTVTINWSNTDSSDNFAGIEIYVTSRANDEYAPYDLVASRYYTTLWNYGSLTSGSTTSCNVDAPGTPGTYFYRVGIIHMDDDDDTDMPYPINEPNYNSHTDINEISGYAKVVIP